MAKVQNIRFLIREILENVFQEYNERPDGHFSQRAFDRLEGPNTDFPGPYKGFEEEVKRNIQFLKDLESKVQGVQAFYMPAPKLYSYHDSRTGILNKGRGVWFIATSNELDTIMFGERDKAITSPVLKIDFDLLRNYINEKGIMEINNDDVKKLNLILKKKSQVINPEKPKENIVLINQRPFVVDKETLRLIKKNDRKVSFNVWDVLDNKVPDMELSDKEKDEVLSYLL